MFFFGNIYLNSLKRNVMFILQVVESKMLTVLKRKNVKIQKVFVNKY